MKRTTRTDVGLAIAFTGISFVGWAIVAGISRLMMKNMMRASVNGEQLPQVTRIMKVFFVETGFVIDIVGLLWLTVGLVLIYFANRQIIGISWAWISAFTQTIVAGAGALLVSWAVYAPHMFEKEVSNGTFTKLSMISLTVVIILAVVIWLMFVVKMLKERNRTIRRGPSLSDGLRTNR